MENWHSSQIKNLYGTYGILQLEALEKTFKFECRCSSIKLTQILNSSPEAEKKEIEPKTFSFNDKKHYDFFIQFNQKNPIDWKACDHILINYISDWINDKRLFIVLYHPVFTKISDFSIEGNLSLSDEGYYDYWVEQK
ncbi:hypothetical protein [Helicobacter cappadocius]|uniref:Uncharacterized protein n=1 Tax=Helicobacter cappadocius TaxID=3063998 RepID=A0AA90PIR4_9HELI|nr:MULTISPECIES: hypothetical protein [unclassified Helicobacter]MDO7252999.1 hypothetical protein [Helicobacter sp. faydin-H75]MDP2539012.1 hypothetical protein [Helicobacter sp. faydin-H76]